MPAFLRAALVASALVLPAAAQAQAASPAARLASYDDQVIAIMKAKLPTAERTQRFERLVRDYYDMPTISQLVAGSAWSTSSAADKAAAIAALTHHSAVSLARNFKSYGGERFTVDPQVVDRGGSQIVKVTIASSDSSDTLFYRMRLAQGSWRIVDVVSGGVSQLAVQRADLASTVAAGGVGGMAKKLAGLDATAK